ncbi:MAG: hypothetical protein ACOVQC_06340 [Flavobacterium sp.]
MRVLALIFMVLAFLVGGGSAGMLKVNIDSRTEGIDYDLLEKTQKEIDDLKKSGVDITKTEDPQLKQNLEILEKAPAKWKVTSAGILGMIVSLLSFVMVIVAFMKKEIVTKVSMLVVALSLLLWVITPDIEAGAYSGANPKAIALISLVALLIASGCAFMSYKLHLKKNTPVQ